MILILLILHIKISSERYHFTSAFITPYTHINELVRGSVLTEVKKTGSHTTSISDNNDSSSSSSCYSFLVTRRTKQRVSSCQSMSNRLLLNPLFLSSSKLNYSSSNGSNDRDSSNMNSNNNNGNKKEDNNSYSDRKRRGNEGSKHKKLQDDISKRLTLEKNGNNNASNLQLPPLPSLTGNSSVASNSDTNTDYSTSSSSSSRFIQPRRKGAKNQRARTIMRRGRRPRVDETNTTTSSSSDNYQDNSMSNPRRRNDSLLPPPPPITSSSSSSKQSNFETTGTRYTNSYDAQRKKSMGVFYNQKTGTTLGKINFPPYVDPTISSDLNNNNPDNPQRNYDNASSSSSSYSSSNDSFGKKSSLLPPLTNIPQYSSDNRNNAVDESFYGDNQGSSIERNDNNESINRNEKDRTSNYDGRVPFHTGRRSINRKSDNPPSSFTSSSSSSSWGEFFSNIPNRDKSTDNNEKDIPTKSKSRLPPQESEIPPSPSKNLSSNVTIGKSGLPPPSYLFDPTATTSSTPDLLRDFYLSSSESNFQSNTSSSNASTQSSLPSLDGVLPVSELFYRSTQSISAQDEMDDDDDDDDDDLSLDSDEDLDNYDNDFDYDNPTNRNPRRSVSVDRKFTSNAQESLGDSGSGLTNTNSRKKDDFNRRRKRKESDFNDDEELPFSAEQSDRILTNNNKIRVRRNNANMMKGVSFEFVSPNNDGDYESSDDSDDNDASTDDDSYDNDDDGVPQYKTNLAKLRSSDISAGASKKNFGRSGKYNKPTSNKIQSYERKKKRTNIKGRKMIRRGMEMLVGGEPINADPPLRCIELNYSFQVADELRATGLNLNIDTKYLEDDYSSDETYKEESIESPMKILENISSKVSPDWASVISTNSRDFGPLLHCSSIGKVSALSKGLYCEHFIHSTIKWKICPRDLKSIYHAYEANITQREKTNADFLGYAIKSYDEILGEISISKGTSKFPVVSSLVESDSTSPKLRTFELKRESKQSFEKMNTISDNEHNELPDDKEVQTKPRGFGKDLSSSKRKKKLNNNIDMISPTFQAVDDRGNRASRRDKADDLYTLGGELKFSLSVTRAELESGHDGGSSGHILRRVLGKGISNAIKARVGPDFLGFRAAIAKLLLNEIEAGTTEFHVEFNLVPTEKMMYSKIEVAAQKINAALAQAMDDGDMALAMAAAAKQETAWPAKVRKRVVEEFLFDTEEEDKDPLRADADDDEGIDEEDDFESIRDGDDDDDDDDDDEEGAFDGPFGMPGDAIYARDDIFLGGGNSGVFPDYSEESVNQSPYKGALGPILLDAVVQRALQRQPRLIAIGDVHGCIDELQALLRRCDYNPGDLVVFLGDLVSKGPDSLSVVQMAREIGAMGVRGNHDFEVIRWHQAIKSGADPPVIGSEHYHIASSLDKADLRWMYSLPWYLTSKELGALFVHAGFVSGIRLGKQNPRLMMNMRSILPDGTVTSKFFNNWPWARLWDGPQTVFFGHDADRGLQQYEHAIGLDTGCVYGGRLTACILPEKRLVSVNAKKEYFQYRRKHFD